MPTFNIIGNIIADTEANWGADATVYTNQQMLVSTDVQYNGTDQNKFKLSNGVDTWSNLDYMPIGKTYTLTWQGNTLNPADLTTYWLATAQNTVPSTGTNGNRRHEMSVAASKFTLSVGLASNGSTEAVTWIIRNHTQGVQANFSPTHSFTSGGQANPWTGTATLSFDAGDFIEILFLTPNWTSNPTGLRTNAILTFQAD